MRTIAMIAGREFVAATCNKGFVIGVILMPALLAGAGMSLPLVLAPRNDPITGDVAVIDRTGQVVESFRDALGPAAVAARRADAAQARARNFPAPLRRLMEATGRTPAPTAAPDDIRLIVRPAEVEVSGEQGWLLEETPGSSRLALVVVHPHAVEPTAEDAAAYDIYVAESEPAAEETVQAALREAIVSARMRVRNINRQEVESVLAVATNETVRVTRDGERAGRRVFDLVMPALFVMMLSIGLVLGCHTLLMSTVEEKSNRIIEVLLSAVSPFELMAGKLLGHLGVTLVILTVQVGVLSIALSALALVGMLTASLLFYFAIFLVVTYLMLGAAVSAIGAAVDDVHAAQSLAGPVMMLAIVPPMFVIPVVATSPTSPLSVGLSFLPPVNTFAMMARLASGSPPPGWQVWASIGVGLAAACAITWFAAKVFKIGLLLHGKPPNLATLVRWAKAA